MDYEKKYKEALERARKCWGEYNELVGAYENKCVCEEIFPELAESEDEKIRKELKTLFLGWINGKSSPLLAEACNRYIAWLEKQGKQKPVEEKEWTIYDAKDGDILNSERVKATIIFKCFADDGKHILAYCGLQCDKFIHLEMLWDRDFEPASEYWKNALFEKIKEKGYEWDASYKVLRKVKQKPKKCMYSNDNYTDEERKVLCDGCEEECELRQKPVESCCIIEITQDILDYTKDKPTFSDVPLVLGDYWKIDEVKTYPNVNDGKPVVELSKGDGSWMRLPRELVVNQINLLVKQESVKWSEEDERIIELIELSTWDGEKLNQGEAGIVHKWLKSLKDRVQPQPQSHWKPTKKQIEAVRVASEVGTANDSWAMMVLKELLKQLKAL